MQSGTAKWNGMENSLAVFFIEVNVVLLYDPAIASLGISAKGYMYFNNCF